MSLHCCAEILFFSASKIGQSSSDDQQVVTIKDVLPYSYEVIFLEAPRVVGLSIGANNYATEDYRLSCCVQEAIEFDRSLSQSSRAHSSIMKDPGSKTDLITFIRESLQCYDQALPELIVVFLAGRSVTHDDEMFFAPCTFKFDSKTKVEFQDYSLSLNTLFSLLKEFEVRNMLDEKEITFVVITDTYSQSSCPQILARRPSSGSVPTSWCWCISCGNTYHGCQVGSVFFDSIMDYQYGIFGNNRKMRESMVSCVTRTNGGQNAAVILNAHQIPQDLCLITSKESRDQVQNVSKAINDLVESLSIPSSSVSENLLDSTTLLVAHSSDPGVVGVIPDEVLKNLCETDTSIYDDDSHSCFFLSSFLICFLWSRDTKSDPEWLLSQYRSKASKLCKSDFEKLNHDLLWYKVVSPTFESWRISNGMKISNEKLCIGILDYTVMTELKRHSLGTLKIWREQIMPDCYCVNTSLEQALHRMEEFLKTFFHSDEGRSILLDGHALRLEEAFSNMVILKISELNSAFFGNYLLRSARKHKEGAQAGSHVSQLMTWMSSSGWLISDGDKQEEWTAIKATWVDTLSTSFQRLSEPHLTAEWTRPALLLRSGETFCRFAMIKS